MTTSRLKSGESLRPDQAYSDDTLSEKATARSSSARWLAFFVVALIGLAVRLPQLGARPMHTDEAVNAYIVGELLGGEPFAYDPQDRHGPALAAFALPLARMQGAKSFSELTESELRLTSVAAGTVTILLFGAAVEMFGFIPSLLAALLFAVAPLPVYYDRYFIHESLFCAATFALILSARRASRKHSFGATILAGACCALMFACKETALLHFLALAIAALAVASQSRGGYSLVRSIRAGSLLAGAGTFVALVTILFTWFGRNRRALAGLLRVWPDVVARAAGEGHQKPFWYYGQLLISGWSGALLVSLACFGLVVALKKRDASYRWLAYYGLLVAIVYGLIPYKTPWLTLNLWLPLALLAGLAIESIWQWSAKAMGVRAAVPAVCIVAALAGLLIGHDTRQRVFQRPADESNPYAYAHTTDDILGLSTEVAEMARRNGINTPRIAVIASDPWPLPWYLRHFGEVGFWQPGQKVAAADFYVTSTEAANQYADQLRPFRPEFFGVRPGVLILLWSPEPK